jgi:hypothetical protein
MASDPLAELGSFLTATEAERLAVQIETGQHTTAALSEVASVSQAVDITARTERREVLEV